MISPELVGQVQLATFALAQQVAQSANDWKFTKYFGHNPHPPTTGLLAIFAALSVCKQVNAFGLTLNLSAPAKASRQGCAKYYVGRPHNGRPCMTPEEYFGKEGFYHDWSMQMRAFQRLRDLGLIGVVER